MGWSDVKWILQDRSSPRSGEGKADCKQEKKDKNETLTRKEKDYKRAGWKRISNKIQTLDTA